MDLATISAVEQMRVASAEPGLEDLVGNYHAHFTIAATTSDLDTLRELCRRLKAKLTVVDLENLAGRSQTDVMATCYFLDTQPGAVAQIADQLSATARELGDAGFAVQRIKLEHESLPSFAVFGEQHYHEIHIKLRIDVAQFETAYRQLIEMGKRCGFVPSRNPLDRTDTTVTQFVNVRLYKGDQPTADQALANIHAALADAGFHIVETKRETVVFDTHQELDAWWTP